MSSSDSDYSIDWLASDEEDRWTPQDGAEQASSSSCARSCCQAASCGHGGAPPSAPQGATAVSAQETLPDGSHGSNRKRTRDASLDQLCDADHQLFSHKCSQLQRYVAPLASILRSLRSGRYSERLSSFQESVAMDRIQRILGVLQNPHMGGRFLGVVLQVEEMLGSWFPHVKPDGSEAKRQKHHLHPHSASPPPCGCSSSSSSSSLLKRLHSSSVCTVTPPESRLRPLKVTQDNSVSSSTDPPSWPRCRSCARPPLSPGGLHFKMSSPCLERLLQAKDSLIAPRAVGDGGWLS